MIILQTREETELERLKRFREQVYEELLTGIPSALFELIDALLMTENWERFPELSLSPVFRRQWSSIYQAIEDGTIDSSAMSKMVLSELPSGGVQCFPLDGTKWPHPSARTLPDLVYGKSPTKALKRHSIVQGHEYSMLCWTPEVRQSWSLSVDVQRVSPEVGEISVGVSQVQGFCKARKQLPNRGVDVIIGDCKYGTHLFFGPLKESSCAILTGLYRNRVLRGAPGPYSGRGRPAVHGHVFDFKEQSSWLEPDEQDEFEHPRWGEVRLRRWNNYHAREDAETPFDVILAEVHLEREKPPKPKWLAYRPDPTATQLFEVKQIWSWFDFRWPIEPSIRFRKQKLGWTIPQFQTNEACDRWTKLVDLAFWQLWLARPLVGDTPLPWQKPRPQGQLSPTRVKRAFATLFPQLGTPAKPPKPRGKSPGWPKGKKRTKPKRFKPVKRGKNRPKKPT